MFRGRPVIRSSHTTASVDSALAVLAPRVPRVTLAEIAMMALREFESSAVIVLDNPAKLIYATTEASIKTLFWAVIAAEPTFISVGPDESKMICHWTIHDQTAWIADESEWFHAANRRTTEGVLNHFLTAGATHVLINQDTGLMRAVAEQGGVSVSLSEVVASGDSWCFELRQDSRTRLVFE